MSSESETFNGSGLQIGALLRNYEIVGHIGAGGMGEVYHARDTSLGRSVAIKVLNERFATDKLSLERFIREAKAASSLNHPNILVIHEMGEYAGAPFIVSEFVEGKTLREVMEQDGCLSLDMSIGIAIQVANALAASHKAHIVHRDIKPENVMVRPDGYVKILDFGLAKLLPTDKAAGHFELSGQSSNKTVEGLIMGTVRYMSPEQARGEKIDELTDIFSLGTVIYEMISGHLPFPGATPAEVFASLLTSDHRSLASFDRAVPPEISAIVDKALHKERSGRYQNMDSLLADLRRFEKKVNSSHEAILNLSAKEDAKTQLLISNDIAKPLVGYDSIAVLPFANLSADLENDYFCDGLAEEILNGLSRIRDLKVAARSSAFSFKGKNIAVGEIGRTLNVSTVLEGSVRRMGNRMRAMVQLINVADGYHIWSDRYDFEFNDIFDIQDTITLAVVDALKVTLLSTERSAMLRRPAENVEAYEYLLKANYYFGKRNVVNTDTPEIDLAIGLFKKAIEVDPNFALAHARLGFVYVWKEVYSQSENPLWIQLAEASLNKAEQINPSLSQIYEARNQIAWSKYGNFDIAAGIEEISKARKFDPKSGHAELGILAFHAGVKDLAIRELGLARDLDPTSDFLRSATVDAYSLLGLYEEAVEIGKPFGCDANGYTHSLIRLGRLEEAETALEDALKKSPKNPRRLGEKILLQAVQGNFEEAGAMIADVGGQLTVSQAYHHVTYDFACAFALNGEAKEAVKWLWETQNYGMPIFPLFRIDSNLDKIRQDPKFIEFLSVSKSTWEDLEKSFRQFSK